MAAPLGANDDAATAATAADAAAPFGLSPQQRAELVDATAAFVRRALEGNDASHDFSHIARVHRSALAIAKEEGLQGDALLVVELAALLHDIADWKYSSQPADADAAAAAAIDRWLVEERGAPLALAARVRAVVARIGFKEELAGGASANGGSSGTGGSAALPPELAIVQDADRLDAIGAVGIARCFTFGGRFQRTLHDPSVPPRVDGLTKQQYMEGAARATTINHFPEKLLKIKALMKTAAGRRLAEKRHAFMERYLEQFYAEWEGEA